MIADTRLDKILTLGTDADRLAFVPDPPTDVLVCWFSTDTNALYVWDGAWNLVATGGGGTGDVVGPASAVTAQIATYSGTSGKLIQDGGKTIATVVSDAVTAATAAIVPIDLATEVTGDLPYANLVPATAASRLLVRGSAGGAGDWQEGTLGAGLTLTGTVLAASAAAGGIRVVGITVDGGGAVVTTGAKGNIQCPVSGTITKWTILGNATGNVTFGVTKDAFGAALPTTSIVASAPPSMTGAITATQSSLGTWTTSVTAGDVFGFEITGTPTGMTRVTLQLEVTP